MGSTVFTRPRLALAQAIGQDCAAARRACNCIFTHIARGATPRAPASRSSTTPTLHAPDGCCRPPLTLLFGSTMAPATFLAVFVQTTRPGYVMACCLSRLTDGPEVAATSHEHPRQQPSDPGSCPCVSEMPHLPWLQRTLPLAPSVARRFAAKICTRGMERRP
jgi:hypothetical protein